jgi:hypothetical protein
MLDRDLRMQAMTLATQLPDDEMTARRVYAMLGQLIDGWIFKDSVIQPSALPSNPIGSCAQVEARCMGKDETFPI